jgi:hypothetical protein
MPNNATSDLLRSESETLSASVDAVGGVGRPHGTLAVEGKHVQATLIWLAPSVRPRSPSFSGQCSADNPLTQLHQAIDVAAFVTPLHAQCEVAHFGQKSFRSREEIGRRP